MSVYLVQQRIEYARCAIEQTHACVKYGSSNLAYAKYSPHNDSYYVNKQLLDVRLRSFERVRSLDAILPDHSRTEILDTLVRILRDKVRAMTNGFEFKNLPINHQRFVLRRMIASVAKDSGFGNCEEMATFTFLQLINSDYKDNLELAIHTDVDHIFVVLGRPCNSDKKDLKTWGSGCVIADPWLNKYFTASRASILQAWPQNLWNKHPDSLHSTIKFNKQEFLSVI